MVDLSITQIQTSMPRPGVQVVTGDQISVPDTVLPLVSKPHAKRHKKPHPTPIPSPNPLRKNELPCPTPPPQPKPGVIDFFRNIFVDKQKEEIKSQLTGFLDNALSPENLKIIDNPILTSQLNNLKCDENLKNNLAMILKGYKNGSKANASIAELLKDSKGYKGAFDEVFNKMVSYANNHTNKDGKFEHYYQLGGYLSGKRGLIKTLLEWGKFDKYCTNRKPN